MLVFIHYFTNVATKNDCSKYQKVIAVIIMRKAFDNHNKDLTNNLINYTSSLDKFALKAFISLFHNWEISGLLVASYLLDLLDHYSPKANIKTINIFPLQAKFSLILNSQRFN